MFSVHFNNIINHLIMTNSRSLLTLILGVLFTASLSAQVNIETPNTKVGSKANSELAKNFLTHLLTGNFAKAQTFMHDDFYAQDSGSPDSMNTEALIDRWKGYRTESHSNGFNGSMTSIDVLDGPQKGSWAMTWGLAQWTGNEADQPTFSYTHIGFRIKDKKIHRMYVYQDNLSIVMQNGFTLIPPKGSSGK